MYMYFSIYIFRFDNLGISRLRGVIMYELQSTLAAYARRKFSSGEISVDHLKNILKVITLNMNNTFNVALGGYSSSLFVKNS